MNEDHYVERLDCSGSSPAMQSYQQTNTANYALNQSSNIYSTSNTPTNSIQQQHQQQQQQQQQRQILVPPVLKKTIHKIDKHINEANDLYSQSNASLNNEQSRKVYLVERNKSAMGGGLPYQSVQSQHHTSNNFLNLGQPVNPNPLNHANEHYSTGCLAHQCQSSRTHCGCGAPGVAKFPFEKQVPRRSYSSCADPISYGSPHNLSQSFVGSRRCASNRSSPIRSQQQQPPHQCLYASNQRLGKDQDRHVRIRSQSRRSKSRSPVPQQQLFRREIKINLEQPKPKSNEYVEEYHMLNNDQLEEVKTVTTTLHKPQPQMIRPVKVMAPLQQTPPQQQQADVQEEVLLNLFSCNNSGSVSSDSSESLVEFEDPKLKINEVYEKHVEEKKIEPKRVANNGQQLLLEKKLAELEKKLRRLPELEIRNNILLEEKQMLIKQLLNMKQHTPPPPPPLEPAPHKLFRSIGCNSSDAERRDVATECKAFTRDVGISNKLDEPKEEIKKMQTIITTLRDKLTEQTLIMQQALVKPVTRDVAIMHVVDRVEKPKPELRDVAINHRTEVDNKELIEKHTIITNTYIKEIETLRIENAKLASSLEELIRKHSKHVVTRGTMAQEQPVLYSVGTNTARVNTRDVQVMFTPKSRDVCLSTDRFYHTRDVALMCTMANVEQQEQMLELVEVKRKYEQMVEEKLRQVKSYRDVAIVCHMDTKEVRSVSLGCNLIESKQTRDVSMRCNLDEEFRSLRDVCIGCNMEAAKELKDVSVMANTLPPPKQTKEFATNVAFEDQHKTSLELEVARLKALQNKSTRDVGVFVDQRSRLMEDQLRNQASSMEQIKTFNRQMNTDIKTTKDFSVGTSIGNDTFEFETKTIIGKADLKQSCLLNTDLTVLNDKIDQKISSSLKKKDEGAVKRQETEYEQRKLVKIDPAKKTRDETITINFSASNKSGDSFIESASFSSKTPLGNVTHSPQLMRSEISIPIFKEAAAAASSSSLKDVSVLSDSQLSEASDYQKNSEKLKVFVF